MRQEEAIRREHEAMDELARIGQELDLVERLICQYGQANQRWFDPEKVRRLNRTRLRLLQEREAWQERRREAAQYI